MLDYCVTIEGWQICIVYCWYLFTINLHLLFFMCLVNRKLHFIYLSVNFIALCIENDQLGHCVCVFSYSNLGIILSWSGKHCIYYFMSMSLLTCLESDQLYNVFFMPIWKLFFSQIWQTHCWILFYYLLISLLTCIENDQFVQCVCTCVVFCQFGDPLFPRCGKLIVYYFFYNVNNWVFPICHLPSIFPMCFSS